MLNTCAVCFRYSAVAACVTSCLYFRFIDSIKLLLSDARTGCGLLASYRCLLVNNKSVLLSIIMKALMNVISKNI